MVALPELEKLMHKQFMSKQLDRIGWSSLSDEDKQVALDEAIYELDYLQYVGEPADPSQPHAWPRWINNELVDIDCGVDKAIAQYVYDFLILNTDETLIKIKSGITSIKVEGASESYTTLDKVDTSFINKNYRKYLAGLIYRGGGR